MNLTRKFAFIFLLMVGLCAHAFSYQEEYQGSIDRDQVRRLIRSNLRAISLCYQSELKGTKDLKGRILFQIEVADGGKAQSVKIVKSELANEKVHNCLIGILKNIQYPAPATGTVAVINYPFAFSSNAVDAGGTSNPNPSR